MLLHFRPAVRRPEYVSVPMRRLADSKKSARGASAVFTDLQEEGVSEESGRTRIPPVPSDLLHPLDIPRSSQLTLCRR